LDDRVCCRAVTPADAWQIASAYTGWIDTDQEKKKGDGGYLAEGQGLSGSYAITSRGDWHLHAIGSAAVQLCPDGDPKVIRLLSKGFLAGVKGDHTRSSLQYSRPTAVLSATKAGSTN